MPWNLLVHCFFISSLYYALIFSASCMFNSGKLTFGMVIRFKLFGLADYGTEAGVEALSSVCFISSSCYDY